MKRLTRLLSCVVVPRFQHPLANVRIASPCPANWDNMKGDEKVRHCSSCQLNVYNLSNMSSQEAADLLNKREGRLCVRFYQRADGTVITDDCPVGLRAIRRRLIKIWATVAVLITSFLLALGIRRVSKYTCRVTENDSPIVGGAPPVGTRPVMGDVGLPR